MQLLEQRADEVSHDDEHIRSPSAPQSSAQVALSPPLAPSSPREAAVDGGASLRARPPPHTHSDEGLRARVYCFLLNFVVLYSYQSLVSAQALYLAKWPDAHLSFVGMVSFSAALCLGQLAQLLTGASERVGFGAQIVPGFVLLALVGLVVLLAPSSLTIILAFAAVGLLNCVTEAPLFSLAAHCWHEPTALTSALQQGNGAAGVANVALLTALRLAARATHADAPAIVVLEQANAAFLCTMVAANLAALSVFRALMGLPTVRARAAERARARREAGGKGEQTPASRPVVPPGSAHADDPGPGRLTVDAQARGVCCQMPRAWASVAEQRCSAAEALVRVWPRVRLAACCQFSTFALTLAVWPGMACATPPTGWFARHPGWYCSPAIIAAYNVADLTGRVVAGDARVQRALPARACALLTCARVALAVPLVLSTAVHPPLVRSSASVLALVFLVGASNGLLATRTMCLGPERVAPGDRAAAASLMVLSLYWGIGVGAAVGLAYGEVWVFRPGGEDGTTR